jgi:hypothetical protein
VKLTTNQYLSRNLTPKDKSEQERADEKTLIVCTCVFNVVLNLIPEFTWAGSLDIPDDYREHANNVEFLTYLARRCNTRLSILGKDALADGEPCRTFMTQSSVIVPTPAQLERWKTFVRTLTQSSDELAKHRWRLLSSTVSENLATCGKVLDHIKFVRTL